MLHIPAGLAEFDGKPVEQLRVGRPLALVPQIVEHHRQALAEKLLPQAVGKLPGNQRIFLIGKPFREVEAVEAGAVVSHRRVRQEPGHGRQHHFPRVHPSSAGQEVRHGNFLRIHRLGDDGMGVARAAGDHQVAQFSIGFGQAGIRRRGLDESGCKLAVLRLAACRGYLEGGGKLEPDRAFLTRHRVTERRDAEAHLAEVRAGEGHAQHAAHGSGEGFCEMIERVMRQGRAITRLLPDGGCGAPFFFQQRAAVAIRILVRRPPVRLPPRDFQRRRGGAVGNHGEGRCHREFPIRLAADLAGVLRIRQDFETDRADRDFRQREVDGETFVLGHRACEQHRLIRQNRMWRAFRGDGRGRERGPAVRLGGEKRGHALRPDPKRRIVLSRSCGGCQQIDRGGAQLAQPPADGGILRLDFRREGIIVLESWDVLVRRVGIVRIDAPLPDIREKRAQRVEILRLDRVELMVVALRAAGRQPEPRRSHRADPIAHGFCEVFLRLRSAFSGDEIEAEKSRGDALLVGGVRQQVAGELLGGELVEGLVLVERVDDVIPVGKNPQVLVAMITDGVGEADDVEPRHRHPLAIMGRG